MSHRYSPKDLVTNPGIRSGIENASGNMVTEIWIIKCRFPGLPILVTKVWLRIMVIGSWSQVVGIGFDVSGRWFRRFGNEEWTRQKKNNGVGKLVTEEWKRDDRYTLDSHLKCVL